MKFKNLLILFCSFSFFLGCKKKEEAATSPQYLYVTSGTCYGGNNTTFSATTASNLVFKVNLATGAQEDIIADFNVASETPGNTPVAVQNFDDNFVMVLIDNTSSTGNRSLQMVSKTGSTKTVFSQNSTIFGTTGSMRSFRIFDIADNATSDNSIFVAHGPAVDKMNSIGARLASSGQTWLSATAGNCISNNNIVAVDVLTNGKMLFAHAFAAKNRFGIISATGYASNASNCLAYQDSPNPNAFPTALVYIPNASQVLVAYAANAITTDYNSIWAYDIDEANNTISNATKIFEDTNILYGISAMTYDQDNNVLYVAAQTSTATTAAGYNIEKFTYEAGTKTLTRSSTTPFSTHTHNTKCISGMTIGK